MFQFVYVAVIADEADVVVPSAVLTNTVVAVLLPACKNTLLCTDVMSVHPVVAELSANHTEKYLPAQGDINDAVNSISNVVISSHLRNTFAVFGFPPIREYIYQSDVKLYNHTSNAVGFAANDSVALYALAFNTSVVALLYQNTSYCLLKSQPTIACATLAATHDGVVAKVVLVPVIVSASVANSTIPLFVDVEKSSASNTKFVPSYCPVTTIPALITPLCGSLPSLVFMFSTQGQKFTVQAPVLAVVGLNCRVCPVV